MTKLEDAVRQAHANHEARRAVCKLYDLASPGSMPHHGGRSAPPTTEELRERLRQNPEMAAEVAKLLEGLTPDPTPPPKVDTP